MFRVSSLLAFAVLPVASAYAQDAALSPALQPVVQACAVTEDSCVRATNDYLSALRSSGLSREQYDQKLADLVVALALIAQDDDGCGDDDRIAATAISLSGNFAVSAGQRRQIEDIAEAVAACDEFATAALSPLDTPVSAN